MKKNTTNHGKAAEDIAVNYLRKNGLKLLERNYRTPCGEIDIIMNDGDTTVFIEVRSRTKSTVLDTMETIDQNKCMRIISSSEFYLQNERSVNNENCRFDVVALYGSLESARLEWIKDAFRV